MRLPDDLALKSFVLRDEYFDLRGLNLYSKMSVSCLRTHIKSDGLPCYLVKGKFLIRKAEFDFWMLRYRVNQTQDLNRLADEIIDEISPLGRRSQKLSV